MPEHRHAANAARKTPPPVAEIEGLPARGGPSPASGIVNACLLSAAGGLLVLAIVRLVTANG